MRIGEGQRAVETDLGIETVVDVLFQLPQRAFRERIDVDFDLFVVVDLFLFLDVLTFYKVNFLFVTAQIVGLNEKHYFVQFKTQLLRK